MPNDARSDSDITTLLDLLEISHKYCAAHIESLALTASLSACKPEKLAYLSFPISLSVLRVAHLVSSSDLARPARARVLHVLWASTNNPGSYRTPFADMVSGAHYCFDALRVGQSTGDTEIIGAAYYAIMLQCHKDTNTRGPGRGGVEIRSPLNSTRPHPSNRRHDALRARLASPPKHLGVPRSRVPHELPS